MSFSAPPSPPSSPEEMDFNLVNIFTRAPIIIQATIIILAIISFSVWLVAILKYIQVFRIRSATLRFENATRRATTGGDLYEMAQQGRSSAGGRVLYELYARGPTTNLERLRAIADRAIVSERKN